MLILQTRYKIYLQQTGIVFGQRFFFLSLALLVEVSQIMRGESISDKHVKRFSVSSDAAVWIFNPVLRIVLSDASHTLLWPDAEVLSARLLS